jgi:hypothetical protein
MQSETKYCKECDTTKPLSEFSIHKSGNNAGKPQAYCRKCASLKASAWAKEHPARAKQTKKSWDINHPEQLRQNQRKYKSNHPERYPAIADNPRCPLYLGSYISETVLSREFKNIKRMPANFPGYDFECNRHFYIDVKSSCILTTPQNNTYWQFTIKCNQVPHFFLCIAWDNRKDLNPLYIWLIPAALINMKKILYIGNTEESLAKWKKYERPLNNVLSCCRAMKAKKLLEEDVEEIFHF